MYEWAVKALIDKKKLYLTLENILPGELARSDARPPCSILTSGNILSRRLVMK